MVIAARTTTIAKRGFMAKKLKNAQNTTATNLSTTLFMATTPFFDVFIIVTAFIKKVKNDICHIKL